MDMPLPIDHELDLMLPKIYKHMKGEADLWENFFNGDYVVENYYGQQQYPRVYYPDQFYRPEQYYCNLTEEQIRAFYYNNQ